MAFPVLTFGFSAISDGSRPPDGELARDLAHDGTDSIRIVEQHREQESCAAGAISELTSKSAVRPINESVVQSR